MTDLNEKKPETASGKTTHFGFATVPEEEKAADVEKVFASVAKKYDLMNDVLSWGG